MDNNNGAEDEVIGDTHSQNVADNTSPIQSTRTQLSEQSDDQRLNNIKGKRKLSKGKYVELNENDIKKMLNKGLKGKEERVISEINYMLKHNEIVDEERARFPNELVNQLNSDELRLLFERFSFRGQLFLSLVCMQWKVQLDSMFVKQSYLWFCYENRDEPSKIFYPIEDCCEHCHHTTDEEPCIKLVDNDVMAVVKDVLLFTPSLKCLRLYRFTIGDPLVFDYMSRICPHLVHLDITECNGITDSVAHQLGMSYPKMKHLILASTKITERQLNLILARMEHLVTLVANRTLIDGSFHNLPRSLERLDIRCCAKLKYKNMTKFSTTFEELNLKHFRVDFGIHDQFIESMSRGLKNLVLLDLDYQLNLLTIDIRDIAHLKHLKVLKIGSGIVFEAEHFKSLLLNCKEIQFFSFTLSPRWDQMRFTDNYLKDMHMHWTALQRLELISVHFPIEATIKSLSQFKHLSYINLTDCEKINENAVNKVIPEIRSLRFIVLDHCTTISKETIEAAIRKAESMDVKDVLFVSMIGCNMKVMPYLKGVSFPKNLVISFSNKGYKRYCTFDGLRCKYGNLYNTAR